MKRPSFLISAIFYVCLSAVCGGQSYGDVVSVDLVSLPESHIDATLTINAAGLSAADSDTTMVTGDMTAQLAVDFDPAMPDVADVNSIRFTGGRLQFSDMSFTLDFSFFGKINATATGVAATPDSPLGAGPVTDHNFDTINHLLILDQGTMYAAGTGLVGGLFEPTTIALSVEPMVLSWYGTGMVSVALESVDANAAAYSVTLILPVNYDEILLKDESVRIDFAGSGVVEAHGHFVRTLCPLHADLAEADCRIDGADIAAFADQWLLYGNVNDCPLSADLHGGDCHVNFADFTVLANEFPYGIPNN